MIASAEMTDYKTISDYAFPNIQKAKLERHKSDLRSVWGRFYHIFLTLTLDVLKTALFTPLLKFYFLLGLAGCIFDTTDNISRFAVK